MKVKLDQNTDGVGGVARVYAGLHKYLPEYGVEIVNDISNADVVHAHIALYEKVNPDVPLVVSSHGMLWDTDKWGGSAVTINRMCIEAYRQADVVTVPSDFVAHALARNMCLKANVVRHGIDVDEWLPGDNQGYVLWNKARVDAANNPRDLDMLAMQAPDVPFLSTYGTRQHNVTLLGQLPHTAMLEYVQHAGVYFDTPKESGGPCFGILEAMSCEVPVLSWNWGGSKEVVLHGETGYLAEPGNYQDLLEGMYYCLENKDRLGKNARQLVIEKYQWKDVVRGYIDAYEQAIAQHQYTKTVSIVIPCYNLSRFLPACLESVLAQSYTNWEAIIVDDASTDNSLEIAKQYAEKDSRISVVHNATNQHVAYSRNRGVQLARGKYILPLDADDRLDVHSLRNMVAVLDKQREINIVSGKLMLYNEDYTGARQGEWPNNAEYELQIKGYNRLPYASMYRRKVWETVGGYRTRIRNGVEDADFWTRALSFGHRAQIINETTLHYTMRQNSLGKQNDKGTDAWLPWFGWASNLKITPFGADSKHITVNAYDVPKVSVIIPVGPGHAHHIQACIDSLLAQTDPNWEAIVINDTGKELGELPGMPFVTLIDSDENVGVAAARNKGILSAKTDNIIFLDVDDIAQPLMVELFLRAYEAVGGWIYSDWIVIEGGKEVVHTSEDWDIERFTNKMLSPITGIYNKQQLLEVGMFDPTAPGWEDWDLQLALVSHGYCGTRLQFPLITYNMQAGFRREDNFAAAKNLIQYIKNKYKDKHMGCSKCGGKNTLKVNTSSATQNDTAMVLIKYTGLQTQTRHINSKTHPGVKYKVTQKPFSVFPEDVSFFLSMKNFERVELPPAFTGTETAVLSSQEPVAVPTTIDTLPLRAETLAFIKDHYHTIDDLKFASDADLLSIKGVGPSRLKEIRGAING